MLWLIVKSYDHLVLGQHHFIQWFVYNRDIFIPFCFSETPWNTSIWNVKGLHKYLCYKTFWNIFIVTDSLYRPWWVHICFLLFLLSLQALVLVGLDECTHVLLRLKHQMYRKTSNISRTFVGNAIVDNSDVVGASPVGAAPTTSSFST